MTTINFEVEECPECGIVFQVPEEFSESRQEDGREFYCPNGHKQQYADCVEDEIEKLEEQNRALQIQVRKLKCKLLGRSGIRDRIMKWLTGKP